MSLLPAARRILGALLLLLLAMATGSARADGVEPLAPAGSDARTATDSSAPLVPTALSPLILGQVTTPHFRILYTRKSEGAARELAKRIEEVREGFRRTLGRDWPGVTEVRLGVGRAEYEALALGDKPPSWALALAYPDHNAILFEATSLAGGEGFSTLTHELSHVALGQLSHHWPRWFQEGLAMHLSGERYGIDHYSTLFRAVSQERIFRFEDLTNGWPDRASDVEIAYAQSLSFVDYLVDENGTGKLGMLLDEMKKGEEFQPAFARSFGATISLKETQWQKELPARYAWLPFSLTNSLLWLGAAGLCVAAFAVRRARKTRRLEELAAEDAAEDAARRLAEAESAAVDPYALPSERPGLFGEDPDPFAEAPRSAPPAKPTIH